MADRCVRTWCTGPWIIDPPLPNRIPTGPFTIRFKCLWHVADLCPKRYIVILRGPTIYAPSIETSKLDPNDGSVVTVEINVPESGQYELYAWPDFETCPKQWREHMTYPINRGQVIGTPAHVQISGRPLVIDGFEPCVLGGPETVGRSQGRWIARSALQSQYRQSDWARSFPENQEYIFQPYSCKRPHRTAADIDRSSNITNILFLGDSVLRGAFCSQVWPQLSKSGKADGNCQFINDAMLYHVAPKDMVHETPKGQKIGLSFRFMDDHPNERVAQLANNVPKPSHIVTNLGLWLAPFTTEQYTAIVEQFLQQLYDMFPQATVVWRTTTDVAPMIQCFSDKGMTRRVISEQREASLKLVEQMRAKGMRIYVVDGYAMTQSRPDSGNDGRHWVVESPEENGWLPHSRPSINEAERAVLDGVWDIIMQDEGSKSKVETAVPQWW